MSTLGSEKTVLIFKTLNSVRDIKIEDRVADRGRATYVLLASYVPFRERPVGLKYLFNLQLYTLIGNNLYKKYIIK